jgi:S-adenosylmethionine hydrolase
MVDPIITLTTDFGLADPYVAEMKAVILGINPNAKIVDISHQVEKFNIKMGAYILAAAAPYFPRDAIHVAVIDPGVGAKRKPILIETENSFLVGPDNGLLALAAEKQGIRHVYEIANPRYMLPKVSTTFHGRDIFAPAAAYLSKGVSPSEFGREIHRIVKPRFAKIFRKGSMLIGEIIHVDSFGNIITNFTADHLESISVKGGVKVKIGEATLRLRLCKAYAKVETKKPLAIICSHDFLEISVNQGNAAEAFKAKVGDKVILYRSS